MFLTRSLDLNFGRIFNQIVLLYINIKYTDN